VSDVVGVIDSLQMKREFVSDSGAQELRKVAVSEIDVKQGRGRVGRQAPGFYIAVSHEDEYENLRPAPLPVTHTGALSGLILQAALADLDIHNFPFVAAPDWARVERDRLLLQRLGALDESFRITELGSKLAALPIEPRSAVALLKGKELGVAPAVAVAVSVLEAGEYFLLPHRTTEKWVVSEAIASILKKAWTAEWVTQQPFEEAGVSDLLFPWLVEIEGSKFGSSFEVDVTHAEFPYRRDPWRWIASVIRSDWANQSGSDFVAAVYAYQMYVAAASKLGGDSSRHSWRKLIKYNRHLAQWCDENFLHYKGLQRVAETFRDLSHRWGEGLDGAFYSAEELLSRKSDPSRLSKALLAGYFDQFGVLLAQGRNLFRGLEESFVISHSSACPQRWPLVLAGRVRATNIGQFDSTVMQRYTEMCAPIELSWLEEITPQHIEWEYAGPANYHRDKDSVRCERVTRFRGVVVRREEVVVGEPELSTPVFVRWLLLNRELLPEAVQEILQRNDSILANVRGIDQHLELGVEAFESGQSYNDWLVEKLSGRASCKVIRNDSSLLLLPARDLLTKTLRALALRKS
jgi:HrpA-like RNA helicase